MRVIHPFYLLPVGITIALLALSQATSVDHRFTDDDLVIVCTTTIIKDALTSVAGERVKVVSLMGPGVDPHTYKARESDSRLLARADYIIYNGLHLEGKINTLFEHMSQSTKVICMADALENSDFIYHQGHADPHIWHDVELWRRCVARVSIILQAQDPDHAHEYQMRTAAYLEQLDELDRFVRNQIALLDPQQRLLITAHDAFTYYARAYNIEVVGLQGISTDAEITTHDVQSLVDLIVVRKIKTIFVESALPTRPLRAVQDACRMRGWHVALGDFLYSDALGDTDSPAATYLAMIRSNTQTIVSQLRS